MSYEMKDFGGVRLTRARAIREKCIDCCGGQKNEVRACPLVSCSLFRYRLGRELSEDELAAAIAKRNADREERLARRSVSQRAR